LNLVFQSSGRFVRAFVLAAALVCSGDRTLAQTAAPGEADAEQRLQWLNARVPPKAATAPRPTPAKVTAPPKIGFRASRQNIGPSAIEPLPAEARPTNPPPAEKASAESPPATAKSTPAESMKSKPRSPESRVTKASPTPSPKMTPAPVAKVTLPKPTPAAVVAEPARAKTRAAESRIAKATPTPVQVARLTQPANLTEASEPRVRPAETRSTPAPKPPALKATPAPVVASLSPPKLPAFKTANPAPAPMTVRGSFPWKTNIATTVFWIGEPVGGNNFTPNYSSSWDVHWTRNFGGLDTPDPEKRRNFIPMKFTPRQNPFYVALPYNDVTRGTTKPESRRVIPWFKEAYTREGKSVCRDRWVAIRNHAGQVAYAQWSDCGPFRTDHWQYVFGNERPKPNLNRGAGLDVSPAVRDYLGLDGHDFTDWKFVDFKDVPNGPWARYGDNNGFVQKASRPAKSAAKAKG